MDGGRISVNLSVSREEYDILKEDTSSLAILPVKTLAETLTTGTIGNSNRIMMPNKVLKEHDIQKLKKNVPARIFEVGRRKILLIMLEEKLKGVPEFGEEE